jgi:hypothetical protein
MSKDTYSDDMEDVYVQILSNDPNELKLHTMEIIYNSINNGQLAYMDAKDPGTGEIVPLLVGLDPTSNGKFKIYPVAQLLIGVSNIPKYLVPNGAGEYYDTSDSDGIISTVGDEEESGTPEGLDKNQIN